MTYDPDSCPICSGDEGDDDDVCPECDCCGEHCRCGEQDLMDREDCDDYGIAFADPGGRSALRAATPDNPRNQPCPNCGEPNRLTPLDVQLHYQCDECADQAERGY